MDKTVIEINGVKMEVDLRTARRIDTISIGARVKVLKKTYSGHEVKHGVVIGFEPFDSLPTIIIAYLELPYGNAPKIEFLYFNSESKDVGIVVALDDDKAALDKCEVVALIESEITKKRMEIADLNDRKRYFEEKFATYWTPATAVQAA